MGEPDATGRFGRFGGRFIPETLIPALRRARGRLPRRLGRPGLPGRARRPAARLRRPAVAASPSARRLSELLGVRVLLKREDLNHTGAHKINNVLGQALLAQRMGKQRVIAETGAGQHGVATATAAALLGLECVVYMGEVDMERQALNVFRMRLLGAEVRPAQLRQPHPEGRHQRGHARLGGHRRDDPLLPRLGDGPAPVPVDGARAAPGDRRRGPRAVPRAPRRRDPDVVVGLRGRRLERRRASSRGFAELPDAELVGVEPAGGAAVGHGVPGIVHGTKSFLLQDEYGQVMEAQSISAGLDYPGVGPEHAHLADIGRARYETVTDDEVLDAFATLSPHRGHHPGARVGPRPRAGAPGPGRAGRARPCCSTCRGRGDKDVQQVSDIFGPDAGREPGRCGVDRTARGAPAGAARRRPQAARPLRHRRPRRRLDRRAAGLRRRRRRRHRGRHPVLRPGDGRPDDPGGVAAGPRRGAPRPASILSDLRGASTLDVPLVAMTYVNVAVPHWAPRASRPRLVDAGVAGVILPDLPMEELGEWEPAGDAAGLETVLLASPITPDDRLARAVRALPGLRLRREPARRHRRAGRRGRAGRRAGQAAQGDHRPARWSWASASSTAEQAAEVAADADGVVVGSALMRAVLDGADPEAVGTLRRRASAPRLDA